MSKKGITLLSILLLFSMMSFSQDNENIQQNKKIRLQISTDLFSDQWMQWEQFIDGGKDNYPGTNDMIPGFTIELYKPSRLKNINYLVGTTFLRYDNKLGGDLSSYIHENQLTGGGAFIGAEFSPQYKVIGFSIKMAVGYFNMSRTIIRFSDNPNNVYSVEKNISSGSLANILQASLNLKLGRFSLVPSAKLIFAGGNQMSVIAPGVSLGAGYTFK